MGQTDREDQTCDISGGGARLPDKEETWNDNLWADLEWILQPLLVSNNKGINRNGGELIIKTSTRHYIELTASHRFQFQEINKFTITLRSNTHFSNDSLGLFKWRGEKMKDVQFPKMTECWNVRRPDSLVSPAQSLLVLTFDFIYSLPSPPLRLDTTHIMSPSNSYCRHTQWRAWNKESF